MTGYERALDSLAEIDRSVAARLSAERETDPWFTEGYDIAHQRHLDAMGHVDVDPDDDTTIELARDPDDSPASGPTRERTIEPGDDLTIEP